MPDKRAHRGPHPEDGQLFAPSAWPALRQAVADLSWLLSRGYAEKSALKVVGDHFSLTERQRIAVMRCSCSDEARERRQAHRVDCQNLGGQLLLLDGYNVLTTIEAALSGGVIIQGRDGCYRDMASMHGTYRKVTETGPAITLLGEGLASLGVDRCTWYLDSPVSNSGRLKTIIRQVGSEHAWDWQVEVVPNPDAILARSEHVIATADSVVLDRCARWFNLGRHMVDTRIPGARVVNLSQPSP